MANRSMERCSMSFKIKEMPINTTVRYALDQSECPPSVNQQATSAGEDVGKVHSSAPFVGMQTGAATGKNSVEVPQKTKNRTTV